MENIDGRDVRKDVSIHGFLIRWYTPISGLVSLRFFHPFGVYVAILKCFPVSPGMFEFSGNSSATVMIDLPQKLGLSRREDFPIYFNLYLNELRPMGHRVFCMLQPQRKSNTKEVGLYR